MNEEVIGAWEGLIDGPVLEMCVSGVNFGGYRYLCSLPLGHEGSHYTVNHDPILVWST
jgi:hypothetical protein